MKPTALCWIDETIIPAAAARIPVFDHGLLYGDGVFEGLRFYHGKTFMLDAHLERLQASAQAIALQLPYHRRRIAAAIDELVQAYGADSGYLRLVVTRGAGNLGIDPRQCPRPGMFIIADQIDVLHDSDAAAGIRLHVARVRRTPAACLDPRIKSLNYLNNILARIEANRAGMDEAVMLNLDGHVSEGSVDNIFIVRGGVLATPPLGDGMLAGITRDVVIDIAAELGIECVQSSLGVDDLYRADECFLSGTGAELIAVAQIDARRLAPPAQPLMPRIQQAYADRIALHCKGG